MSLYREKLSDILDRCREAGRLTKDQRIYVHDAYWNGNRDEISWSLEALSLDPKPEDMPILMDASSPGSWWVHRCDVAEALSHLKKEGPPYLKIMLARESHYCARFWICRALIDLGDDSLDPFLDGPIPPNSSPFKRSLWIYGNFEFGNLTKEEALSYLAKLLENPRSRETWLRDHLLSRDA